MKMPVTESGLRTYDDLAPDEAVVKAWFIPGSNPGAHAEAQRVVRDAMPLLARALDRAAGLSN